MKKQWMVILLLLMGLSVMAQNVTVSGRVNRPKALVRLMVVDDLLNRHETTIAETNSDEQGFFLLEGKISQILPASIAVGLESVDLIVCPGAAYEVSITVPEVNPNASYFERQSPTLRVKTASDKGVYRQIIVSEQIINSYVLSYFDELYRRHQYRYIDSIRATIDQEMDITSDYVRQHNDYKIASVQMAVNADGGKKVIREYFDRRPVLYSCQAYMDLFKDLFVNKFWQSPYTVKDFEDAFWGGPVDLKEYLDTDPFMARNPDLAEMITIFNLRTMYYEQPRFRKVIIDHLKAIYSRSKNPETKKMVSNMLERFGRFATGADAPDFELVDVAGKPVRLSDYKNTTVVLQFVEGSSRTVDHQFEAMADLHHHWQDSVQFITVTTKDQLPIWKKRFEEHGYDWPLLNLGNDILLLERYEVRTLPEYFIIQPKTKIGMAPAPSPDQTMDVVVNGIIRK